MMKFSVTVKSDDFCNLLDALRGEQCVLMTECVGRADAVAYAAEVAVIADDLEEKWNSRPIHDGVGADFYEFELSGASLDIIMYCLLHELTRLKDVDEYAEAVRVDVAMLAHDIVDAVMLG